MGFKHVTIKDLETSIASAFIGMPIRRMEIIEKLQQGESEIKKESIELFSDFSLLCEEIIEYIYDKEKNLTNFSGTGVIRALNSSKKDRVWDSKLTLTGMNNINLEGGNTISLGNFEPRSTKNVNYSLIDTKELAPPLKLTETIEVTNVEIKKLRFENKEEEIEKIKKQTSKKQDELNEEIAKNFDTKLGKLKSDVSSKEEYYSDVMKQFNNISNQKEQLSNLIEQNENEINNIVQKKIELQIKYLKDLSESHPIEKEMDLKTLKVKNQEELSELNNRIEKTKINFQEKKNKIISDLNKEYDPQIKAIQLELDKNEKDLKDALEKADKLKQTNKDKKTLIKDLSKNQKSLLKDKSKELKNAEKEGLDSAEVEKKFQESLDDLEKKLESEESFYEKFNKELDQWEEKRKNLDNLVKQKRKIFEELVATKENLIDKEGRELSKLEDEEIKSLRNNVVIKEEFDKKIDSIINKHDTTLEEFRSKLNEMKKEYNKVCDQSSELFQEKNELESKIINLKNEVQDYEDKREFTLKEKLEEIYKEEDAKKSSFLEHVEKLESYEAKNKLLLLFNQKNSVKFTLKLENVSDSIITDIKLGKLFSEDFYDFKYKSDAVQGIEIENRTLFCTLNELKPGAKAEIIIFVEIYPSERKIISTGTVQISYLYKSQLISGLDIENFSGYSHVMHAMNLKEMEEEPNKWHCFLTFLNNSDFNILLKSINVVDENRKQNYLDLHFDSNDSTSIIHPGSQYESEGWMVESLKEPKFYRKLEYGVTYQIEKRSIVSLKFDDRYFDIADLRIDKKFSQHEIKSFEENVLQNVVMIKNLGTIAIKSMNLIEMIPSDFLPSFDSSEFQVRNSSGKISSNIIKVNIIPYDKDPTKSHQLELSLNLQKDSQSILMDVDDFLEIKYPLKAITPNHKKAYNFPLDYTIYFPYIHQHEKEAEILYYIIQSSVPSKLLPQLKVIHKRRDLLIGKEIFPGRELNEFGISVIVRNNSDVDVEEVIIKDTLSKSFKFISSNINYELEKSKAEKGDTILFTIEKIQPYQEKEIRYYVKKMDDKEIEYDELESFIFG